MTRKNLADLLSTCVTWVSQAHRDVYEMIDRLKTCLEQIENAPLAPADVGLANFDTPKAAGDITDLSLHVITWSRTKCAAFFIGQISTGEGEEQTTLKHWTHYSDEQLELLIPYFLELLSNWLLEIKAHRVKCSNDRESYWPFDAVA